MIQKYIHAEGVWCENCEVFEQEHDYTGTGENDTCMSCGCTVEAHTEVKVISK